MNLAKLETWNASRKMVATIYDLCKTFPNEERYELCKRMKGLAVSAPANIAKGVEGRYNDDLPFYFNLAQKNYAELISHLMVSQSLGYLDKKTLDSILNDISACRSLAYGFLKYNLKKNKQKKQSNERQEIKAKS